MHHKRSQNAGVVTLVDEFVPVVDALMRISSRTFRPVGLLIMLLPRCPRRKSKKPGIAAGL
jgi:hypothetical protein